MPTRGITVNTNSGQILQYNNRRTGASVFNNGTVQVFISEDNNDIANQGYPIAAGGAIDLVRTFGSNPQDQWFAITASSSANVRILEEYGQLPELFTPPSREAE